MKLKIINENYVYRGGQYRLQPATYRNKKPWVTFDAKFTFARFPTHAEAIRYADKMVRGLREEAK